MLHGMTLVVGYSTLGLVGLRQDSTSVLNYDVDTVTDKTAGSVKMMSKTLQVMSSLHVCIQCAYFYKCKIALIAIKLLLFQAISRPMAWPGRDFQHVFAPVEVG